MTSVLSLMGLTISAPDHTTVSRRAVTLPVIQATLVPHGPLHVLIDSTGLQVYERVSGWRRSMVRGRAGNDASAAPLGQGWIAAIGRAHMLARGATARLIPADGVILALLEDWRAEIDGASQAKKVVILR